jgi:hypothetical protein
MRAALLAAVGCAAGCEDQLTTPNRYSVLAGKVLSCHANTGELTVRVSRRSAQGPTEETIYCVVTRDSEIYINDKFSSIEEIQLGDAVELVGYDDPNPRLQRFVVSFAYFDHPLPAPPPPELVPASAPTTQNANEESEQREG